MIGVKSQFSVYEKRKGLPMPSRSKIKEYYKKAWKKKMYLSGKCFPVADLMIFLGSSRCIKIMGEDEVIILFIK